MDIIESKLIAKVIVDENHHAFAKLVTLHQSQIRNYARRLCKGDNALADDISQETFITAFEKVKNYDARGSFIGWLLTICYRHFLQYIRKNKLVLNDDPIEIQITDNIEPQILIEQALYYVTHEERSAITLNSNFGHTHQEISKIMQLPIGTVKSHISRGKAKIMELLSEKNVDNSKDKKRGAA
ncbi:RNA polymerase sigma factor [Psychrosphaera sp. F3M07]|uniref:RNA polymerase sigma factor n=1 Tax=Psychrosphaera sp. F3M07 TaxID=2841560 RepID=UPI001C08F95E|nr:RNA polymerase sigma factor [Psychrosphaera sp. F3M07]MBU2916540.1 RNA polymerase sigma factor [Psychrosphaera sp. F3M07]